MNMKPLHPLRALPLVLAFAFAAGSTWAQKPEWAGQGKGGKQEQNERSGGKSDKADRGDKGHGGSKGAQQARPAQQDVRVGAYFGDQQRVAIRDYYGKQYSAGRCPPGLAKKNNGCMPPGQAKKWAMGQPLPRDVVFYPVPNAVLSQLGTPPSGHKYVRVASDILLIATGSRMIVDAIQDLGRM
jgi:Ni/Co efflux regulator RcnB